MCSSFMVFSYWIRYPIETMSLIHTKAQEGTEVSLGTEEDTCRASMTPEIECPMVHLLSLLSGKWALPVLFQLSTSDKPIRFNELRRAIGLVTQKELTRTLREFEERGFVTRKIYAEVPPRVEYAVTPLGRTLKEPMKALANWVHSHGHQVLAKSSQGPSRKSSGSKA